VQHAGETLVVDMGGADMTVEGALPDWATQKTPGQKITLAFGFAGWGEIEPDDISIRRRFLGWANFLFDTNSPFHGKSTSEVVSLITSGDRIDAKQSNLSLAWDNILYNAEWQHLDVWTKLLQTIVMAFVGTLFAMLLAFPLAFLAARNITRNWISNQVTKRLFDFLRSVDMLIWALFFTRAFGPGPLAGMSAIFFTIRVRWENSTPKHWRTLTTSSVRV
jgi:phosphonate transport system permease protein